MLQRHAHFLYHHILNIKGLAEVQLLSFSGFNRYSIKCFC